MITADFASASSRARSALDSAPATNAISGSSRSASSVRQPRAAARTPPSAGGPTATTAEVELPGAERLERVGRVDLLERRCLVAGQQRADRLVAARRRRRSARSAGRTLGEALEPAPARRRGRCGSTGSSTNAAAPARSPSSADGAVADQRDREVAGVGVLLELPEHRLEPRERRRPAAPPRAVLAGEPERGAGAAGDDRLGAARADGLDHGPGAIGVGVDHQHDAVAVLERVDLVGQLILDRQLAGAVAGIAGGACGAVGARLERARRRRARSAAGTA